MTVDFCMSLFYQHESGIEAMRNNVLNKTEFVNMTVCVLEYGSKMNIVVLIRYRSKCMSLMTVSRVL